MMVRGSADLGHAKEAILVRTIEGPGKFEGEPIWAPYVWAVSLSDGGDEQVGSVSEHGVCYILIRGGIDVRELPEDIKKQAEMYGAEELTDEENEFVAQQAGFIIREDDQGFVSVEAFETEEDLEAEWAEKEKEIEEMSLEFEDDE